MVSRVLIVDDNEHNREYARQALDFRWPTESVSGGRKALEAIARERPGVVLLDLSMPGIDGWEVLRRLREDPATQDLPVVACTAHAMAGDVERGMAAGFNAYLAKPYRPRELVAIVESYLGPAEPGSAGSDDDDWGDDVNLGDEDDWRPVGSNP